MASLGEQRKAPKRAFRLTAPAVSEVDFQAAVADMLDLLILPPAMWFPIPVGHVKLTPAQAARLARIGVKRGLPDLLVIHQGVIGIELKRDGGVLSRTRTVRTKRGGLRVLEGQRDSFPRLQAAGMRLAVCETVDEVLAALMGFGVPLRRFS